MIPVQNTAPDVDPDEFLSALDSDTRAYLQLLINGAGKGLENGGGNDLREVFQRARRRPSAACAGHAARSPTRKRELKRLINNYGSLLDELADKDNDVRRLITASNATLSAFAPGEREHRRAPSARCPARCARPRRRSRRSARSAQVLRPTLESLRPAFRQLDVANREVLPFVREAEPIMRKQIRPFVQVARPYVNALRPAARNLRIAGSRPDRLAPRAQPLLQHGARSTRTAVSRCRRAPAPRRTATRATCSGSAGSRRTRSACSRPPTRAGPFRRALLRHLVRPRPRARSPTRRPRASCSGSTSCSRRADSAPEGGRTP